MRESRGTSAMTVGVVAARRAVRRPISTRAPAATASLTTVSRWIAEASSMTVPTRVASSVGSPQMYSFVFSTSRAVNSGAIRILDEDAFDRGAALAGVPITALGRERHREIEVGVVEDDERIVAAEFEHELLVAGGGGDAFADGDTARERRRARRGDADQGFGDFTGGSEQHAEHRPGQAGLVEQFGEAQRGQGRFLGRLEDDGRARGDGGRELVRDLIERMIERRDAGGATQRVRACVKILRALPWGEMSHEKIWPSSRSASIAAKRSTSRVRPTS